MKTVANVIIKNNRNYIAPKPFQNLFALNAIAVQTSSFPIRVKTIAGHEIWVLVSVDPSLASLQGITSRYVLPVMDVTINEDDDFLVEFGHIDFNARNITLGNELTLPELAMSKLPDGRVSEPSDKRYVCPIRVCEVARTSSHRPVYGATIYPDYFRTSVIDDISEEDWTRLTDIKSGHMSWSEFLDRSTNGNFTVLDDISDCLIELDSKYIPKEAMVSIRHARIKSRIEERRYAV